VEFEPKEAEMSFKNNRKLYVFKIGERQAPSVNHLYLDYKADKYVTSCMYFWCITGSHGPILVDHGFTAETVARLNVDFKLESEPQALLTRIGVKPEEVEHVILTHLHWDHFVGETIFPNATYYVQKKEIEYITGPLMRYECFRRFMDPEGAEKIVRLLFQGKVVVLDGDCDVFPEIETVLLGGHSPGSQGVVIRIGQQEYGICGDVVPRYRNLEHCIPCGINIDPREALTGMEKMEMRVGSADRLFPSHDPLLLEKTARYTEGVYLIAE
jgi:glyoxylase-like metal-dependent hydrolase (beta-lactamase superfamily II)